MEIDVEPSSRPVALRLGNIARRLLTHNGRAYLLARRTREAVRFLAKQPHDADFAAFGLFKDRTGVFLDVGANMGQSACSFRIFHDAPILSIEPNPEHRRDLRLLKRLIRRFDFLMIAAGEDNGWANLRIPMYRGASLTGEATLDDQGSPGEYWASRHLGAGEGAMAVIERPVEVRRLDDLGLQPSFVKLDVEGFELPALRGLKTTLEQSHPIVLVERTEFFGGVQLFLDALGYRPFTFDAGRGALESYDGRPATNVFFLPA